MCIFDIFKKKSKSEIVQIAPPAPEEFRYIWNHQLVVFNTDQVVDLITPLVSIDRQMNRDLKKLGKKLPFVVGDNGNLIAASFMRCIFSPSDSEKSSLSLEYTLDTETGRKVILRIVGNQQQSIYVKTDERIKNVLPLILILPKIKRPQ